MESSITQKIEDKLKGLKNVKEITSTSSEGVSTIIVEFVTGTDIDMALQKVKDKVDMAKPDLPTDLDDEPTVDEINLSEEPILVVALSGQCGPAQLRDIADDLEEKIEGIPGVLEVEISGGLEREIHIEADPNRMVLYGVPFSSLSSVVSGENANISGGSIRTSEGKFQLRLEGEFETPEEAKQIVVMTSADGNPVYLSDIAVIKDDYKDLDSDSRLDGKSSVNIYVKKRSGENIIEIIDQVDAMLEVEKASWPTGTRITRLLDRSKEIRLMLLDLENNIITGLLLVIVVVFFAMGLRNAILVSLSIPLSMLLGFIVLRGMGITLNMVVLFSLTLALGMLVDNAIVIIENIYRFMQEGVPRLEAAMRATSEVAYPVIGSALTTIGAFTPMLWWSGIMGDFMVYLPITVITLLSSCLFVAMVINPAMAAVVMRVRSLHGRIRSADEITQGGEHPLLTEGNIIIRTYRKLLYSALGDSIPGPGQIRGGRIVHALSHVLPLVPRMAVLCIAMLCLVGSIMFWYLRVGIKTPQELFPTIDPSRVEVSMDMPEGADLAYCDFVAREVEKRAFSKDAAEGAATAYADALKAKEHAKKNGEKYSGPSDIENVESCYTRISSIGGDNEVALQFIDFEDRKISSEKTLKEVEARMKDVVGADITVDRPQEGPPTGAPINIEVSGDDLEVLGRIAEQVKARVRTVPFIRNLKDDYSQGSPTLSVKVNRKRAAYFGLSSQEIGYALRAAINGVEISTYRENNDDYDIVMRFADKDRHKVQTLRKIFLPTSSGKLVPLTTVAAISYEGGLGEINRIDHNRVVSVSAEIDPEKTTGTTARTQAEKMLTGSPLYDGATMFSTEKEISDFEKVKLPEVLASAKKKIDSDRSFFKNWSRSQQLSSAEKDKSDKGKAEFAMLHKKFLAEDLNLLLENFRPDNNKTAVSGLLEQGKKVFEEDPDTLQRIREAEFAGPDFRMLKENRIKLNRLLLDIACAGVLEPNRPPLQLPDGYAMRFTGEQEDQQESSDFLSWALSVALAIIFLILVSQFNSVLYPFIIISSVILSLGGVFLGLGFYQMPFGIIMTGVGVISLAGVVVNNAIVLIDYTIQLRERGMERDEAIIAAGATRLRPVILTAITTVLGLVPMVTGWSVDFHPLFEGALPVFQTASESSQWWKSMAVAVIFGLGFATMLTLVIVPVLFSLLDDIHNLVIKILKKLGSRIQSAGDRYWYFFWKRTGLVPTDNDPGYDFYISQQSK